MDFLYVTDNRRFLGDCDYLFVAPYATVWSPICVIYESLARKFREYASWTLTT